MKKAGSSTIGEVDTESIFKKSHCISRVLVERRGKYRVSKTKRLNKNPMALSRVLIKQGGNLRKSHCNSRVLEDRRGRHRNKIHVDRRVV